MHGNNNQCSGTVRDRVPSGCDAPVHTVTLKNWKGIHRYATRLGWIYRGQGCDKWTLQTSLERCCDREGIAPKDRSYIEKELLRDFRRTYHQYAQHVPDDASTVEWFSLMQHHGAPTRLLDFNYSIYVAAYFALENANGDCAVWAVHGVWALRESQKRFLAVAAKKRSAERLHLETQQFHEKDYHGLLWEEPFVRAAFPLNPFGLNKRLHTQHATFMAPGTVSDSFMENFCALDGHTRRKNCIKIVIPSGVRKEALERLFDMNISRKTLFPGLDGYAQSLRVFHPSFRPDPYEQLR